MDADRIAAMPVARPRPNVAAAARSGSSRRLMSATAMTTANTATAITPVHSAPPSRCDSTVQNAHTAAAPAMAASTLAIARAFGPSRSRTIPTTATATASTRILRVAVSGDSAMPVDNATAVT